jgi:hypothetical protein
VTVPGLPPVSSPGDAFLAAIAQRQDRTNELMAAQNELLAQIRDRLPAPVSFEVQTPGVVELREPATSEPEPEALAEPAQPEAAGKAARRAPRKRTTTKTGGA